MSTAILTLSEVEARILRSNLSVAKKDLNISVARKNAKNQAVLSELMDSVEEFDIAFLENQKKRDSQRMSASEAKEKVFVPNMEENKMTAKEKKNEHSKALAQKLLERKAAVENKRIQKKLAFGVGFHEVIVLDFGDSSNIEDWMWVKLQDVETKLYTKVWWYIGTEDNGYDCDKIISYICKTDPSLPDKSLDAFSWLSEMKQTSREFIIHASISKYDSKKLFVKYSNFDKEIEAEFADEEEGDEPETVGYNDAIGNKDDIGNRPTEEEATYAWIHEHCEKAMANRQTIRPLIEEILDYNEDEYDDDPLADHIMANRKGMLSY